MKKNWLLLSILVLATGCSKNGDDEKVEKNAPKVELTGNVTLDKMKWLRIEPTIQGGDDAICSWTLGNAEIADTKELLYVFDKAGSYTLVFKAKNEVGETVKNVAVTVVDKTYVNGISKVYEYLPAPGQFINIMPAATSDDTPETMRKKAEDALTGRTPISLGGFGGYVTFGFDHTIVNREGKDFTVLGNAIETWAEPGVIMVSYDANGNGLPDDEWFEIAGSEYNKPTTVKNYEITYYKPESEPANPKEPNYIRWTDNRGQTGYISKNVYHPQTYYPQWAGASYTLKGTFMESNLRDVSGNGTNWSNAAYDWGYVDNWTNADARAQIDISWAVDKDGNPVKLKGVDFMKVYTGNRAEGGLLGEVSTEVSGFSDLNLVNNN